MNRDFLTTFSLIVLFVAVVLLSAWTIALNNDAKTLMADFNQVKDSLATLHRVVDSLKTQTPGLGEYMSTMQLHTAKLWFAGQASNWKLVKYEVDELEETIEAAEALHARKNDVDISSVLQSMRRTQLPLFEQSIAKKSRRAFGDAYSQTLATCNGCHRPAGYEFIQIIPPTREPVTNQQWNVVEQQRAKILESVN